MRADGAPRVLPAIAAAPRAAEGVMLRLHVETVSSDQRVRVSLAVTPPPTVPPPPGQTGSALRVRTHVVAELT